MQQPVTKLSEYLPPSYSIEKINLKFELSETATIVTAILVGHKNAGSEDQNSILKLNGENQRLVSLKLNETVLNNDDFKLDDGVLTFVVSANDFQVTVVSEVNASDNKALEGLYLSDGIFCTQCEPEGFRRITFFPDRPDVLSIYTTTIIADKGNYPILLSNGNVIDAGNLSGSRHFVTWHDPFPKPSYLFALVGGNLDCLEDSFKTKYFEKMAIRRFLKKKS